MSDHSVEATGKTVEDAIDEALEQLGAREDEVEIKILEEGGPKGILGRKVVPARVRVAFRDERTEEDLAMEQEQRLAEAVERGEAPEPAPSEPGRLPPPPPLPPEELEEQGRLAEEFLSGVLEAVGIEGEITISLGPRSVRVEINGEEMGLLIGRHGATLEALQDLARAAVQRQVAQRPRVNLDIEGYRARQRGAIERRARDAAQRVRRSRKPYTFEPMSAFARKAIHDALARFDDIESTSEGDEPNRQVVIRPKGANRGRGGGRRSRGGRGRGNQRVSRP